MKKKDKTPSAGGTASPMPENDLMHRLMSVYGVEVSKTMEQSLVGAMLYKTGCTPDDYKELYDEIKNHEAGGNPLSIPGFFEFLQSIYAGSDDDDSDTEDEDGIPDFNTYMRTRHSEQAAQAVDGMESAEGKTLVLRIQLDDMKKPPLWREVEIPADYSFGSLHNVIQKAMGWTDTHLHMFETRAGSRIGVIHDDDEVGYGPDYEEEETPVTAFLSAKGDKISYRYDFGDDWSHTVSVVSVDDRKTDCPRLRKTKGGQVVEDCGGTWGLQDLRDIALSKGRLDPEAREMMEWLGVSSRPKLAQMVTDDIDIDEINAIFSSWKRAEK